MSDTLLILLPGAINQDIEDTENIPVQCLLLDEEGRMVDPVETMPLSAVSMRFAPKEIGSRQFVVLLAGEDALLTSVALPRQRQIRRALPFLIEEDVAQDPEDIHVILGPILEDGSNAVAIVGRDLMAFWVDALAREDIYPDVMLPETLLLPLDDGSAGSLVFEDERCLLRTGLFSGLMLERQTLFESLRICFPGEEESRKALLVWVQEETPDPQKLVKKLGKAVQPIQIREQSFSGPHLELLGMEFQLQYPVVQGLNLLQASFAPTKRRSAMRALLARVAGIALLFFLAQMVFDTGKAMHLRKQAEAWNQASTQTYRELFPQDRRIVNLRAQMENHLNLLRETGASDDFVALLGSAGSHSRGIPAQQFELQRVTFNEQNQSLILDLHVSSLQILNRYKQALTEDGMSVDIASAATEDNVVRARLRVSRTGA